MRDLPRARLLLTAVMLPLVVVPPAASQDQSAPLRVCADPNNAPFSSADGSGFENRIAEIVAGDLGRPLAYVWWAQRRGFIRNTLSAGVCDVVIGVPAHHYDQVLRTRPYYRSSYVAIMRADGAGAIAGLDDPRLRQLRIGVPLAGDPGTIAPPALALARRGIADNVRGYLVSGDYREAAPPQRLIEAVASGEIDVALAWGPLAGPSAKASAVPLTVSVLQDEEGPPLSFSFEIAMAVRRDDLSLRRRLQDTLDRRGDEIRAVLAQAGVPILPFRQPVMDFGPALGTAP
jgi:mxaJ protein